MMKTTMYAVSRMPRRVVTLFAALALSVTLGALTPHQALAQEADKNVVVHIGQYSNDLHSATMGVAGKPVHVAFDGGRLTSDAGVLVLAEIERELGLSDRLARCIEDPRAPERVRHGLAEMIRFRALMIAADYEDAVAVHGFETARLHQAAIGGAVWSARTWAGVR